MTDALVRGLVTVARWLADYGEPYAPIGGMAVVLRARPRFTDDIDVLVCVPGGSVDRLLASAGHHGFTWDPSALPEPGEEGLIRLQREAGATPLHVDVMYAAEPAVERLLARATTVHVAGCDLRVATSEDLILMKLEANRGQDLDDVLALREAAGDALDRAYLRACAAELDLVDRVSAFID